MCLMKYFFYTHVRVGTGAHTLPGSWCFCDQHLATSAQHRLLSELRSEPRFPFLSKGDTSYPKAVVRINQNKVQPGSWHNIWHSAQSFSQLSEIQCSVWWLAYPWREPQTHKGKPASLEKAMILNCQLINFPFIHSLENCLKWAHGKQSRD